MADPHDTTPPDRDAEPTVTSPDSWPSGVVLVSGVATAALTLGALFLINQRWPEVQPMGWYVNLVIPVGALLVGLLAGSGYGLASWLSGAKIGSVTLLAVVLLQVWAYFAAQNLEYQATVSATLDALEQQVPGFDRAEADPDELFGGFWTYFDATTRSIAFTNRDGDAGEEFGAWGYAIRVLEILGFALGGLVAPALLRSVPYCERCGVYMKTEDLGVLPAGVEPRKIKKKDTEGQAAYEAEITAALEQGEALAVTLLDSAESGDPAPTSEALAVHQDQRKAINKQTARLGLSLRTCPCCEEGEFRVQVLSGHGEHQQSLADEARQVGPAVIRGLSQRHAGS